jgi:putative inorganic carbon (hco3(-)) transporter
MSDNLSIYKLSMKFSEYSLIGLLFISVIFAALITYFPVNLFLALGLALIAMIGLLVDKRIFVYVLTAYTFSLLFAGALKLPGGFIALIALSWGLYFWHYRPIKWYRTNTELLLIIFAIWSILTLVNAPSINGGLAALKLLLRGYLLYFLLVNVLNTRKAVIDNVWVIVFALLAATLYGLLWFSRAEFSLETMHGVIRVRGFGADPNIFSVALLGGIPFLVIKYFYDKGLKKIVTLGIAAILILGLVLSYSRSGVVALLFAFGCIVLLERRRMIVWIIMGTVLIIAVILVPPNFVARMLSALELAQDASIAVRIDLWNVAMEFFKQHPIKGIGLGQFVAIESGFTHHIEPKIAHNMFLEIATETGIVGLIIFLGILGLTFFNFWRAASDFKQANDIQMFIISAGMWIALLCFCLAGLFLSNQYYIVLWYYLALGEAVKRLSTSQL